MSKPTIGASPKVYNLSERVINTATNVVHRMRCPFALMMKLANRLEICFISADPKYVHCKRCRHSIPWTAA